MNENRNLCVEVDGEQVFTAAWVKKQMQALMDLHRNNRTRINTCFALTAASTLLSLVAVAIAAM